MYIKYAEYDGQELAKGDSVLMSHDEFVAGGKDLRGVALTVTPDGAKPVEMEHDMD